MLFKTNFWPRRVTKFATQSNRKRYLHLPPKRSGGKWPKNKKEHSSCWIMQRWGHYILWSIRVQRKEVQCAEEEARKEHYIEQRITYGSRQVRERSLHQRSTMVANEYRRKYLGCVGCARRGTGGKYTVTDYSELYEHRLDGFCHARKEKTWMRLRRDW